MESTDTNTFDILKTVDGAMTEAVVDQSNPKKKSKKKSSSSTTSSTTSTTSTTPSTPSTTDVPSDTTTRKSRKRSNGKTDADKTATTDNATDNATNAVETPKSVDNGSSSSGSPDTNVSDVPVDDSFQAKKVKKGKNKKKSTSIVLQSNSRVVGMVPLASSLPPVVPIGGSYAAVARTDNGSSSGSSSKSTPTVLIALNDLEAKCREVSTIRNTFQQKYGDVVEKNKDSDTMTPDTKSLINFLNELNLKTRNFKRLAEFYTAQCCEEDDNNQVRIIEDDDITRSTSERLVTQYNSIKAIENNINTLMSANKTTRDVTRPTMVRPSGKVVQLVANYRYIDDHGNDVRIDNGAGYLITKIPPKSINTNDPRTYDVNITDDTTDYTACNYGKNCKNPECGFNHGRKDLDISESVVRQLLDGKHGLIVRSIDNLINNEPLDKRTIIQAYQKAYPKIDKFLTPAQLKLDRSFLTTLGIAFLKYADDLEALEKRAAADEEEKKRIILAAKYDEDKYGRNSPETPFKKPSSRSFGGRTGGRT
jgi:hypothetical protein